MSKLVQRFSLNLAINPILYAKCLLNCSPVHRGQEVHGGLRLPVPVPPGQAPVNCDGEELGLGKGTFRPAAAPMFPSPVSASAPFMKHDVIFGFTIFTTGSEPSGW